MIYRTWVRGLAAAAIVAGLSGIGTAQAADMNAKMLADMCNGCHGPDGSSYGPATPSIAGTNKYSLIDAMKGYRDGARPSTIMARIAKGYTDAEIEAIAVHFAGQKRMRVVEQEADMQLAMKGKELTREYCNDCHAEDGMDAKDYPALAGQPMPYLTYQLQDLLSGKRNIDNNEAMSAKERRKKKRNLADVKEKLGWDGFTAAVHFYGSQK